MYNCIWALHEWGASRLDCMGFGKYFLVSAYHDTKQFVVNNTESGPIAFDEGEDYQN